LHVLHNFLTFLFGFLLEILAEHDREQNFGFLVILLQ
jgi:hypothetical protein